MEMRVRDGSDMWQQLYRQASDDKRAALARAREAEQEARELRRAYGRLKRIAWGAAMGLLAVANAALYALLM